MKADYHTNRAGDSTLSRADTADGDIALLDRMLVTGTRTQQRVSDVPVRTEVVTRQQLAPMQPASKPMS